MKAVRTLRVSFPDVQQAVPLMDDILHHRLYPCSRPLSSGPHITPHHSYITLRLLPNLAFFSLTLSLTLFGALPLSLPHRLVLPLSLSLSLSPFLLRRGRLSLLSLTVSLSLPLSPVPSPSLALCGISILKKKGSCLEKKGPSL